MEYDWSAGLGFPGLFQTIFNNTHASQRYAFGLSALGMSDDRIQIAHFLHDFMDNQFAITVPRDDLTEAGSTAYVTSLAKLATVETWVGFVAIFAVSVLLIAYGSEGANLKVPTTSSVHRVWTSAFRLFAATLGQSKWIRDRRPRTRHPILIRIQSDPSYPYSNVTRFLLCCVILYDSKVRMIRVASL